MGLDMYLFKRKRNETQSDESFGKHYEEVAYWRKANCIHKWFVDNVQEGIDDCGIYEVTRNDLHNLVDICTKVLANRALAEKLLPVCQGFFFGSHEYDEYYIDALVDTISMCQDVLDHTDFEQDAIFYCSSW